MNFLFLYKVKLVKDFVWFPLSLSKTTSRAPCPSESASLSVLVILVQDAQVLSCLIAKPFTLSRNLSQIQGKFLPQISFSKCYQFSKNFFKSARHLPLINESTLSISIIVV